MSKASVLTLVELGGDIIPIVILMLLHLWPKVLNHRFRIITGIFISWVLMYFYTDYIYNPAGIAAGHESGMQFPEGKYDNNKTSIALFFGWMYPLFIVIVYSIIKKLWKKYTITK